MSLRIGPHMSITNGILNAAKSAVEDLNATAFQCFLKSPRGGKEKEFTNEECDSIKEYLKEQSLFGIVHCSYLLNFAKDFSDPKQSYQLTSLVNDANNAVRMGMHGIVYHIGKTLDLTIEQAENYIVKNLIDACQMTSCSPHPNPNPNSQSLTRILLETTAGQGTEVAWQLTDLARLFHKLKSHHHRIGICVDTCHIFAAGHDIRTKEAVEIYFKNFDDQIGLEHLDCIHLNDSIKPLGSRVDRHMDIGKGMIGEEGLKAVVRFADNHNIPCILETPQKSHTWRHEISLGKDWIK